MEQAVAIAAESRRRTSVVVTSAIALALVVVAAEHGPKSPEAQETGCGGFCSSRASTSR